MDISELTFKILLIFLPGIISLIIVDILIIHRKWDKLNYLLYAFVLGLLNYSLWYLFSLPKCSPIKSISFLTDLTAKGSVNAEEVALVSVFMSIPLGLLITFVINKGYISQISKKIGVSKRFGDVNLFAYLFNAVEREKTEWVLIRDHNINRMFEGRVGAYSPLGIDGKLEIFLLDVKVYDNSTDTFLYETPGMYLAAEYGNVLIEFPKMLEEDKQKT